MQVKLLNGGGEGREQPDGEPDAARGLEDIEPAACAVQGLRAIKGLLFEEARPLLFADDVACHLQQEIGRKRLPSGAQTAANTHGGRQPCFQMQVAGAIFHRDLN